MKSDSRFSEFRNSEIPRVPVPVIPVVTSPLPRVPTASCSQLPRVEVSPSPSLQTPASPHQYPIRHVISQYSQEEANQLGPIELPATVPETTQHWANAIIDPDTSKSMEYRQLIQSPKRKERWTKSLANEFERLAQGVGGRIKGTQTIFFVNHNKAPADRCKDVTHGRIYVNYRPQKAEPGRTRPTAGGNLINYPGGVSKPTSDTTTTKPVMNSTISMIDARYMCLDIHNFCLGTAMKLALIPQEIID